ncbi:MAG: site-specific integrase [Chthoniobacterales bacterium]
MPKRPSLEPKQTTRADLPWLVNLPPLLSGTAKRERRYFSNKKEAAEFCRQQRIRLENYGTASALLPAGKVEEAQAAFEKLKGTGIGLLEAVDQAVEWQKRRNSSVSFKVMFEKFMEAKKAKRSIPYLTALRCTLPRFAALHDRLACEISAPEIEEQLNGMSASVHNAFLRYMRAVFNFGIRRDWCQENPVKRIEMQSLKMRREILSNAQVMALLKTVCETEFELLPYHVLCIFAGIRPKETERLEWKNINMGPENFIEVPEELSKTARRRIVKMEPLLVRWLRYYIREGGERKGLITPRPNLRKRLRAIRAAAGIERWPQDAPRRTYASCWLAIHADVDVLNRFMGHTSPDMLFKHYEKAVTQKHARAFWKIEPPRTESKSKIIPLVAA